MVSELFRVTSRITSLAKSGRIVCARNLFDELPSRDTVAWNSMITSYSHLGLHQEAISLFTQMRISDSKPDGFTFTSVFGSCAGLGDIRIGKKVHALVISNGYEHSLPVSNSLIDMYGKCFDPFSASKVFEEMADGSANEVSWCSLLFAHVNAGKFGSAHDVFTKMPIRVLFAWNIMISGHAWDGDIELCLGLFRDLQSTDFSPDCYTFSAMMNACAESSVLFYGTMMHAVIIKTGWGDATEAKNSILTFYAKLGSKAGVVKELESVGMLTQISWNAIIDAYMKLGETAEALDTFQLAPNKNIVSWTTMIAGYTKNGDGDKALRFFIQMMKSYVGPDDFVLGAVLHACSSLAVLGLGRMVHGCAIRHGFEAYAYVGNGLVNMYAKCGSVEESHNAFRNISDKDLVSWNTMLLGFGIHGLATQAIQLYQDMVAHGTKPDKVTFIALLITCSHSGLVEEGRSFFYSMKNDFMIPYEAEHVACMVNMLGRGGFLAKAKTLAKTYQSLLGKGRVDSLEASLKACSMTLDGSMGESLNLLEANDEISFVLLSNMYCASGKWQEAEMVRRQMVKQGVKKQPGCSWIDVNNEVVAFVAGNNLHPLVQNLSETICCLGFEMKNSSFFEINI